MIVLEVTEDKFGKLMKAVSKIVEHADCIEEIFSDMTGDSEYYGNRYGNRKKYDDDDFYSSRYNMRGGIRRM